MMYRKKLIEVALPLEAINKASAREKSIRHGHPSTLHLWWARRPLAAARAVLFAQLVDDPSSHPEQFPSESAQNKERERLFRLIEDLVKWENTNNEQVLNAAREEIRRSWRLTCKETGDDPDKLPAFHDPFAGGGSIPLEAQRLGLEAYASDLNPVAVLINKAMIEIPPKFAGNPPVNPKSRANDKGLDMWQGAQGLAEDVRYYGNWMRDEAEKRIGHLYPKVRVTAEMAEKRPDLKPYKGRELTVIAWLWARTVKSPNPAFADMDVPLVSSFVLSSIKGREAWADPIFENGNYRFEVRVGNFGLKKNGTVNRKGGVCLISGIPMPFPYIREEGKAGRMGQRLMAVVCEGDRGRVYLSPTIEMEKVAAIAEPKGVPETDLPKQALGFRVQQYGMVQHKHLFTNRQLVALTTFSDLVMEAREQIIADAKAAGMPDDGKALNDGGNQAKAYGDAVAVYLAFAVDKCANLWSSICSWMNDRGAFRETFARHAISMIWDFAEANPFSGSGGNFVTAIKKGAMAISAFPTKKAGIGMNADAITQKLSNEKVISTDPPYYDNIAYADLSDFFYVWLRKTLNGFFTNLFATMTVPKADELVATPYRHGSREAAEQFFIRGMTKAIHNLATQSHNFFPITIYYAFKQSENRSGDTASTGWETFLEAVIQSDLSISGTWPVRTEGAGRIRATGANALASSIVLVCRKRAADAQISTRRDFQEQLRAELPKALRDLQKGNIAPVDFAQSAIGPGMAVFSRYSSVVESDGTPMSVRKALGLINEMLDEILSEEEGELDPASRWAVAWFEQYGISEAPFGQAENLCKAKNTSVQGLADAGLIYSKSGRVNLLRRDEIKPDWNPDSKKQVTVWEATQHLIRTLEEEGEEKASELLRKLDQVAEQSRDLAYRLYQTCEKKGWAEEARSYNTLVVSWPELTRLASRKDKHSQESLGSDW